ncbi:threonine dehydratase [Thalassobacillus cyri]|uniref:threonine ammonia-lyase n=1 Tax=Thalassobacillus cyri TaxID=571932 RepID=A0A1H3ZBI2_9BACI|nr:hydroxyectoine utilization dehydratase EutB [Thalassobacillus cyri]SEA20721.1 threonine dehydratase [Thalassobacillus cyri]
MESVQTAGVTFRDIWRAKKRITSVVEKTPLLYSQPLSDKAGTNVYLKLENMQPTGAFKLRGAANKMLSLSEEARKKGVATFSTGNHGIAVAHVAGLNNIPATVCISRRVPQEKVKKLKRLGAHVEIVGENQDDAEQYCYELEKQSGITVVKPFDDPEVIAGQGTIGLEILEECPEVDQAIIPLSGGGLLAGISLALKSVDSKIDITGVSMEKGAVMHESLKRGKPVVLKESDTLADSLLGGLGPDNRYTFPVVQQLMDKSVLVSEESIAKGIMFMLEYHKMAIEGAAGAGIGWLLGEETSRHKHIVIVISGNNVDHDTIRSLADKY